MTEETTGCPVAHNDGSGALPTAEAPSGPAHPTMGGGNRYWWPHQLNLKVLAKNPAEADPFSGDDFDYAEEFLA